MATGYKMYADSQDFNSSVGFPSVINYEAAIQRLTGMSVSSLAHRAVTLKGCRRSRSHRTVSVLTTGE